MTCQIINGDCINILPGILDQSIDSIITDLPYGTSKKSWDTPIPLDWMWKQVDRLLKPGGVFVTTACQPFTSLLICSNMKWFRQAVVWDKANPVGFLDCKRRLLKVHEDIVVFSKTGTYTYNPQMVERGKPRKKGGCTFQDSQIYNSYKKQYSYNNLYYPTSILRFSNHFKSSKVHPTQKPVDLYKYLVLTFSNPGDIVLDFCCGVGTTGEACNLVNRDFIGIEMNSSFFKIACERCNLKT